MTRDAKVHPDVIVDGMPINWLSIQNAQKIVDVCCALDLMEYKDGFCCNADV
jgi:hypothetical protein